MCVWGKGGRTDDNDDDTLCVRVRKAKSGSLKTKYLIVIQLSKKIEKTHNDQLVVENLFGFLKISDERSLQQASRKLRNNANMSYQLYRNTTLGHTLQETLDELVASGQISQNLAYQVLLQFDKAINNTLATRVKNRVTFKANHLSTYRFCDNVWTFVLKDVEFREIQEIVKADRVKIVACDGKSQAS